MAGRGTGGATYGSIGAWLIWFGGVTTGAAGGAGGGGGNPSRALVASVLSSVVFDMTNCVSVHHRRVLNARWRAATRPDPPGRRLLCMAPPWVIVGAGSAGCVAAARLSEDADRAVVLLEAGPDLLAGAVPSEIDGSDFLAALAVPDRTFADLTATRTSIGPATPYARGRGVGGSSVVNAMVALRGDRARYRSWGWDDVDDAWSRVALPVELPGDDELGSIDTALLAAAPDAHPVELTRRGRRRVTSAEAYLWPARQRPNLEIRADSAVDRVIIDGHRATGVQLMSGDTLVADRVILAAGAIHTPAILLRSDIDTPGVGEGLQDHPSAALTLAPARGRPWRASATSSSARCVDAEASSSSR